MRGILPCILEAVEVVLTGVGGCDLYDGCSEWCAMCAGGYALHAVLCSALYTGGCGGLARFGGGVGGVGGAGGVGYAGGHALCATLYTRGCESYALFMELLEVSEVLEVMRRVLCMLEVL